MKTAKQREEAFRQDFNELLQKHMATIDIIEECIDYSGWSRPRAVITMFSEWDLNNEQTSEYTEFFI